MINQINSVWWLKLNALYRQVLLRGLCKPLGCIAINEYPKSGGSWLGQMLSEAVGLPFPRNKLPPLKGCVLHGHYLSDCNVSNMVIVWRDGRDVLVSQYYHYLFYNDKGNKLLVDRTRAVLGVSDPSDISANLLPFMEAVYSGKLFPSYSWPQFVSAWLGKQCSVKYEMLRLSPAEELVRLAGELEVGELSLNRAEEIAQMYSFERLSGRKPGEVNNSSFMRKGVVGDWKNHFNLETREAFHHYAGNALIALGYEDDGSWVAK